MVDASGSYPPRIHDFPATVAHHGHRAGDRRSGGDSGWDRQENRHECPTHENHAINIAVGRT